MEFWVSNFTPLLLKPTIAIDRLPFYPGLFSLSHTQSIMLLHVLLIYAINNPLIAP